MNLSATITLLALASTGLPIALYFTLVYYGRLEPNASFLPQFCSMPGGNCTTILHHPEAKLFRIVPNSVFGIGYYALVAGTALWLLSTGDLPWWWDRGVTVVSWATVAISLYLAYALIVRIRIPCKLCFTSHAINLLIAAILTLF